MFTKLKFTSKFDTVKLFLSQAFVLIHQKLIFLDKDNSRTYSATWLYRNELYLSKYCNQKWISENFSNRIRRIFELTESFTREISFTYFQNAIFQSHNLFKHCFKVFCGSHTFSSRVVFESFAKKSKHCLKAQIYVRGCFQRNNSRKLFCSIAWTFFRNLVRLILRVYKTFFKLRWSKIVLKCSNLCEKPMITLLENIFI